MAVHGRRHGKPRHRPGRRRRGYPHRLPPARRRGTPGRRPLPLPAKRPRCATSRAPRPGKSTRSWASLRLLNASLPREFQLTVGGNPVSAAADAAGTSPATLAGGQILVEYDRRENWEAILSYPTDSVGVAQFWTQNGPVVTARVWVDDTRAPASASATILAHELIHALGRTHPDPARFPDSIMNIPAAGVPGYLLQSLDRDALLAVYSTLPPLATPGAIATDLGPWAGAPGLASSGTTWLDGDLNYTVRVEGNTFGRTGGGEGRITGVFSGANHEGMAGTLTRDDLRAGFAGTR